MYVVVQYITLVEIWLQGYQVRTSEHIWRIDLHDGISPAIIVALWPIGWTTFIHKKEIDFVAGVDEFLPHALCFIYFMDGINWQKKRETHTYIKQSWPIKVIICGCLVYLLVHTFPDRVVTIEVKEEIDTLIEQLGRMTWTRTGLTILTKIRRI